MSIKTCTIRTDGEEIIISAGRYNTLVGMFFSAFMWSSLASTGPHRIVELIPWPPKVGWRLSIVHKPVLPEEKQWKSIFVSGEIREIAYDEVDIGDGTEDDSEDGTNSPTGRNRLGPL